MHGNLHTKIIGQGCAVLHCRPSKHWVMVTNINSDRRIEVYDGIFIHNQSIPMQIRKIFATNSNLWCNYKKPVIIRDGFL